MNIFRKSIVLFFSLLCVYFSWKTYEQWLEYSDVEAREARGWGPGMITVARKHDRLLVFSVKGVGDTFLENPTDKTCEILSRHYIRVTLDKKLHPGDYGVLRRIYKIAGGKGDLSFGILSPRGLPLFLGISSDNVGDPSIRDEKALAGAAWLYKSRKSETKEVVSGTLKKADNQFEESDVPSFFMGNRRATELVNLRSIFITEAWGRLTAVMTENTRLSARLALEGDYDAVKTAELALSKIFKRLKEEKNLFLFDKLLLTRALLDFYVIMPQKVDKAKVDEALDFVVNTFSDEGFFLEDGEAYMRENAIALSIMIRAYKIFGDKKYKEIADKSAPKLAHIFDVFTKLPTFLYSKSGVEKRSEASALDHVLLARAYVDIYLATDDEKYYKHVKKIVARLDELFLDETSGSWYENSVNSVFVNVFRFRFSSDSRVPATIGEALQMIKDLNSYKTDEKMAERYTHILAPMLIKGTHGMFLDLPSSKLATLPNPMLKVLTDSAY